MKVIVLDELRKKNNQICELLQRKKHKVISCHSASMFLEAMEEPSVDRVLMNVDSWQLGRAIYKYFNVPVRLSSIPVIFYNAPENFVNINAREKNGSDRVLPKTAEVAAIAEALE